MVVSFEEGFLIIKKLVLDFDVVLFSIVFFLLIVCYDIMELSSRVVEIIVTGEGN